MKDLGLWSSSGSFKNWYLSSQPLHFVLLYWCEVEQLLESCFMPKGWFSVTRSLTHIALSLR